MKHTTITAALAITTLGCSTLAGTTISQSAEFAWDVDGDWQIASFNAFDDMGGNRELTGVSFQIDMSTRWDVRALNYDLQAFEPGDWFGEGLANFNALFGGFNPGSVEVITGINEFSGLTGTLGAGSGSPFGPPGDPTVAASYDSFISANFGIDNSGFGAFTSGPVDTLLVAFTDTLIDGPNGAPGFISIATEALVASGTLRLDYTYSVVPAPSAAALLGLGGMLGLRRRR